MKNQFLFIAIVLFFTACSKQLDMPIELEESPTYEYFSEADQEQSIYVVGLVTPNAVENLKKQFSDFNAASGQKKRASNIFLGSNKNQPVIIIRRFDDFSTAADYAVLFNKEIGLPNQFLPISQYNYRTLLRKKDFSAYRNYYKNVLK